MSWLCRVGLHKWRKINGRMVCARDIPVSDPHLILYDRHCTRCDAVERDRTFTI